MTKEEEKAIKELESATNIFNYVAAYEKKYLIESIKIVLNLIQKLHEENEKKDKMIDLMAECMAESISCDFINITDVECINTQCKECMKRYFNNELDKRTRKEKE